ncbi:hypothetical protein FHX36_001467 [Modestobacter versicolor]|uniref:Integral membrane protein n=2 Tax=Modestobacter versicolor TaxID=429133 RepID=A0A839Y2X2_9ACTN|nr:hypothetical protein [Modestobacter versicolor]MBB3675732.1 hypothetical protein [Modestobacter versicolor]
MTALSTPLTTTAPAPARLLQLDGVLCAAMGLTAALAAGPVAELLGTTATGVVRGVGIALVVYAAGLLAAARSRWARPALRAAAIGNVAWEAASLAVAVLADLGTTGRVLVAAQGLVVGALAVVQLRAGRR